MKLIYAIVERDNAERVTDALNSKGYQATMISSTGGFLKKGNSTIMTCTEDDNLQDVVKVIKTVCGERVSVDVNVPYNAMVQGTQSAPIWAGGIRQTIQVGGAVIIAVEACFYEKI